MIYSKIIINYYLELKLLKIKRLDDRFNFNLLAKIDLNFRAMDRLHS